MITRAHLKTTPAACGVYFFLEGETILYIGKAVNLKARIASHIQNSLFDSKEKQIITRATSLKFEETLSEFEALIREASLIAQHKPQYNISLKDDKSYLYIKITIKDEFPKVYAVRREHTKKTIYFGPFESTHQTRYLLRFLRRITPFCTAQKISSRPCFYSKIGLCNPCPNMINSLEDEDERERLRKIYKKNINRFISILSGRSSDVLKQLEEELVQAINREDYKKGIELRNKIYFLKDLIYTRSFREEQHAAITTASDMTNQFKIFMKTHFELEFSDSSENSYRIECYDISTLFGKDATGSMVVFEDGFSRKDQYRRFKIKKPIQSDIHMMEEVIRRRFKSTGWPTPDLVIIDGGRPQLRKVRAALKDADRDIPLIGIAKRPDRLILGRANFPAIAIERQSALFNLIREIRDESHRFARKYHLLLRHRKKWYNGS